MFAAVDFAADVFEHIRTLGPFATSSTSHPAISRFTVTTISAFPSVGPALKCRGFTDAMTRQSE